MQTANDIRPNYPLSSGIRSFVWVRPLARLCRLPGAMEWSANGIFFSLCVILVMYCAQDPKIEWLCMRRGSVVQGRDERLGRPRNGPTTLINFLNRHHLPYHQGGTPRSCRIVAETQRTPGSGVWACADPGHDFAF